MVLLFPFLPYSYPRYLVVRYSAGAFIDYGPGIGEILLKSYGITEVCITANIWPASAHITACINFTIY